MILRPCCAGFILFIVENVPWKKKGHSLLVCQSLIRTIIPHLSVTFYSRLFYIHFFFSKQYYSGMVGQLSARYSFNPLLQGSSFYILCEDNLTHWLTLSPLHYWNVGGVGLTMFMQ